jgi:hypothetical protein
VVNRLGSESLSISYITHIAQPERRFVAQLQLIVTGAP